MGVSNFRVAFDRGEWNEMIEIKEKKWEGKFEKKIN